MEWLYRVDTWIGRKEVCHMRTTFLGVGLCFVAVSICGLEISAKLKGCPTPGLVHLFNFSKFPCMFVLCAHYKFIVLHYYYWSRLDLRLINSNGRTSGDNQNTCLLPFLPPFYTRKLHFIFYSWFVKF